MDKKNKDASKNYASFLTGAIALAFLAIGYQTALFVHRSAILKITANKDSPDTVFIIERSQAERLANRLPEAMETTSSGNYSIRKNAPHSPEAMKVRSSGKRQYESFRFNPNTISIEDLQRLGFSEKQALSIDNYRKKGGKFRRKSDFAKSFVVADSVFQRLEPYIEIPLLDINKADSAAFDALPGIGGYFASKMVEYRQKLGGYSYAEQLMDIKNFDREKFDKLKDLITVSKPQPFRIWSISEDSLAMHPYIGKYSSHGIVLFRENNPPENLTVEGLKKAGILKDEYADKLSRCVIAPPS